MDNRRLCGKAQISILILRNLPPRSLDQGMDQIENIVETHVASGLGSGNITYYNNAFILSTAPILLIGTAISTAAFPRLNNRLSHGRPDLFRKDFLMVIRAMIWISAPLVVLCYFCRGYLARIIYAHGSPQIATIFGFLAVAIFFRILYAIISTMVLCSERYKNSNVCLDFYDRAKRSAGNNFI